ncbi:MAG: DUF3795 domain-containing protein [Candidatus Saccharibacteria bacterium]
MNHPSSFDQPVIAPCGINCSVCRAYLRQKNVCPGCCAENALKPGYCVHCIIKNCALLAQTTSKFCYECPKYPCLRLKQLDKRYRVKYHTSVLENLQIIKEEGLAVFMEQDKVKWTCSHCGGTVCMHSGNCMTCNTPLFN